MLATLILGAFQIVFLLQTARSLRVGSERDNFAIWRAFLSAAGTGKILRGAANCGKLSALRVALDGRHGCFFWGLRMSAIELIVDGYVRLGDRRALSELKAHREHLVADLRSRKGWFDYSKSIRQMDEEIVAVEAGLARLDGVAAFTSRTVPSGIG
jgi:hypothetical protein